VPRAEAAKPADRLGPELETLLADLTLAHHQLLSLAAEHRRAISAADADAVRICVHQQTAVAQRIADLEQQRRRLVLPAAPAARAAALRDPATQPKITAIAETLPEPSRSRILAAAATLKDLLRSVQREHAAIRLATQALLGHTEGLIQQVGRRLSGVETYGRAGRIAGGPPVPCGIDMTH
jgi:hypothetical protein